MSLIIQSHKNKSEDDTDTEKRKFTEIPIITGALRNINRFFARVQLLPLHLFRVGSTISEGLHQFTFLETWLQYTYHLMPVLETISKDQMRELRLSNRLQDLYKELLSRTQNTCQVWKTIVIQISNFNKDTFLAAPEERQNLILQLQSLENNLRQEEIYLQEYLQELQKIKGQQQQQQEKWAQINNHLVSPEQIAIISEQHSILNQFLVQARTKNLL
jgi:hypothetical protein